MKKSAKKTILKNKVVAKKLTTKRVVKKSDKKSKIVGISVIMSGVLCLFALVFISISSISSPIAVENEAVLGATNPIPNNPTGFSAYDISYSSLKLKINKPSDGSSADFKVKVNGKYIYWADKNPIDGKSYEYFINGLQPGTKYTFQVSTYRYFSGNTSTVSRESKYLSATTKTAPEPTGVKITSITKNSVTMSWSAIKNIYDNGIKLDGKVTINQSKETFNMPMTDCGFGKTSCTIGNLKPGTSYTFYLHINYFKSVFNPQTRVIRFYTPGYSIKAKTLNSSNNARGYTQ